MVVRKKRCYSSTNMAVASLASAAVSGLGGYYSGSRREIQKQVDLDDIRAKLRKIKEEFRTVQGTEDPRLQQAVTAALEKSPLRDLIGMPLLRKKEIINRCISLLAAVSALAHGLGTNNLHLIRSLINKASEYEDVMKAIEEVSLLLSGAGSMASQLLRGVKTPALIIFACMRNHTRVHRLMNILQIKLPQMILISAYLAKAGVVVDMLFQPDVKSTDNIDLGFIPEMMVQLDEYTLQVLYGGVMFMMALSQPHLFPDWNFSRISQTVHHPVLSLVNMACPTLIKNHPTFIQWSTNRS